MATNYQIKAEICNNELTTNNAADFWVKITTETGDKKFFLQPTINENTFEIESITSPDANDDAEILSNSLEYEIIQAMSDALEEYLSAMSVEELPEIWRREVKATLLFKMYEEEGNEESPSYGELANIDDIITDEQLKEEYGDTIFSRGDFVA